MLLLDLGNAFCVGGDWLDRLENAYLRKMEIRRLIDTNLEVSRVCLGTMTFGGQVDESGAQDMVGHALESGIDFFDTANNYTGGHSETILGHCLKGKRDRVILASKVFNKVGEASDQRGLSRKAILRVVEETLQRLQTDFLDIYYFHAPDYAVELDESLGAMDQLVRDGKVRYVGASNYASWQLTKLHWIAEREGLPTIRIAQPMYNLIARGIEQEFVPACRELGVSMIAYNPLAGGLLTGKHQIEVPLPGTRFDTNRQYVDRYWKSANFDAIECLNQHATDAGRSLVSLAFSWLLHHSPVDALILGASSLDQMKSNLDVIQEGPLPDSLISDCDRVWAGLRGQTPIYNR